MPIERLTLAGQRRHVAALATLAVARQHQAEAARRQAIAASVAQLRRPETLILGFVSGVTLAMLDPPRKTRIKPGRATADIA